MNDKFVKRAVAILLALMAFPLFIVTEEMIKLYRQADKVLYDNFFQYLAANGSKVDNILITCLINELSIVVFFGVIAFIVYRLWR